MEDLPYSNIEKGTLLISTPEIDTGLFFRSVILVCEHTPEGSFGLVINKNLEHRDILDAVETAFSNGWRLLKLYFMVELPTETEEDLQGIVDLVRAVIGIGREKLGKPPQINLSVSSFIPKPHTPFQWEAMDPEDVLKDKRMYLIRRR